ncbi:MAG: hypothetical protein Q9183_002178, partial [Haloplaca sp. 2 TL-2023]
DVKKVHLDFAFKFNDGHFGARKVWRNYLPRLKYHNPAVSMTVNRSHDNSGPALLTVFYAPPGDSNSGSSPPSTLTSMTQSTHTFDQTPVERTKTINMKHKHESEILSELINSTKATLVVATAEEEAEIEELKDQEKRSEADRLRNAAYTEQKRREKALLEQARGAVGAVGAT